MSLFSAFEEGADSALKDFLPTFLTDDIGKMLVDGVNYAATFVEASGAEKREIAKTQFLNDAEAAGKDIATWAQSEINFGIEAAVQAVIAGGISAALA